MQSLAWTGIYATNGMEKSQLPTANANPKPKGNENGFWIES